MQLLVNVIDMMGLRMLQRSFFCFYLCFINLSSTGFVPVSSSLFVRSEKSNQEIANRNVHLFESKDEQESIATTYKDYSGVASSLFGNLRIPASLFAGASAGAAFTLPISASEGVALGMVKRTYALLMIGSLSSQIITLVVSTMAMTMISANDEKKSNSLIQFLNDNYELEWTTARLFFLSGLLLFSMSLGLRAWVAISCPIVARTALGLIISSTFFCLACIQDIESKMTAGSNKHRSLIHMPFRFCTMMTRKATQAPLFALAVIIASISFTYIGSNVLHLVKYLAAGN